MENKSVCYYCGTVYENELGKCPLCGSTEKASAEESIRPIPRRRITEQERRQQGRSTQGKFSAKKDTRQPTGKATKPILIAAVVLLALAVMVVFYFIGDMIGWWPGLEDTIDRNKVVEETDHACLELLIDQEEIKLEAPGDEAQFTVRTNPECEEVVYCGIEDESIVTVSEDAQTEVEKEFKSVTFTITAQAEGYTVITVTCGDKEVTCQVLCGDGEIPVETQMAPDYYEPLLNQQDQIILSAQGETVNLQVTNLPEGFSVLWTSADPAVATVDASGKVTAVSGGKTTVTADVGGKIVEVVVLCGFGDFIDQGAHLEAGREDVTLYVGQGFYLYLYDSHSQHITDITYTVADPSVCTVEDGYVTATGYGTTTITITYFTLTFECVVRVY